MSSSQPNPSTQVDNDIVKPSPLRILILTPSSGLASNTTLSPFPSLLQRLTYTSPPADVTTFAGYTTHPPLHLKTKYYETKVTIWCDELPSPRSTAQKSDDHHPHDVSSPTASRGVEDSNVTLQDWQTQMLSSEASEVRDVIGSIILLLPYNGTTFPSSQIQSESESQTERQPSPISTWIDYIESITALRDSIEDQSGRDLGLICVLQDMSQFRVGSSRSMSTSSNQPEDVGSKNTGSIEGGGSNRQTSATAQKLTEKLLETLEDTALSTYGFLGWDFVSWTPTPPSSSQPSDRGQDMSKESDGTRNSFGEKTGFSRVLEVLQGTDWTAGPSSFDDDHDDELRHVSEFRAIDEHGDVAQKSRDTNFNDIFDFLEDVDIDLNHEASVHGDRAGKSLTDNMLDRTVETEGLLDQSPQPRNDKGGTEDGGGDDVQIEQLTDLMSRVVAIKEAAESMSGDARERFAKREIKRIMKEL